MSNIFNSINLPRPKRSRFNLTHERTFSAEMGRLIPVFCEEVIPDDKWSVSTAFKLEMAPLIAPLMHNIDVYLYYFFVPNNLLSSAWDTWISQGEPADSPNIPYPFRFTLSANQSEPMTLAQMKDYASPGKLLDYLGFSNEYARTNTQMPSPGVSGFKDYSSLPILAYNAVWLNFFRNQNLLPLPTSWGNPGGFNPSYDQTQNINLSDWRAWNYFYRNNVTIPIIDFLVSVDEDSSSLSDSNNRLLPNANLRHANYMHDYFTASLPFTQRGPQVTISFAGEASLKGSAFVPPGYTDVSSVTLSSADDSPLQFVTQRPISGGKSTDLYPISGTSDFTRLSVDSTNNVRGLVGDSITGSLALGEREVNIDDLTVDLSEVSGLSIIDLRRLSKLQQWLEKNAVGGNNPGENIYNHFGVRPSSCSMDKPIFLGGGRVPVAISNILQTSQSTDTSAQATPSGYARSQGFSGFRNKKFRDYGWILGLTYVMPRSQYIQGTRRYWDRSSRFDYFWMEFERIGEQPVYNYEIFDTGLQGENNEEFGYNPRYADYKYIPSSVHGDFKTSLAFWHAARIFSSRPKLNSTFLHLGEDIKRIFAVTDYHQNLWFWCRHQVKVRRPMMKNPTSLLG